MTDKDAKLKSTPRNKAKGDSKFTSNQKAAIASPRGKA
jgi:hypothetical protein